MAAVGWAVGGGGAWLPSCECCVGGFVSMRSVGTVGLGVAGGSGVGAGACAEPSPAGTVGLGVAPGGAPAMDCVGWAVGGGGALSPSCECCVGGIVSVSAFGTVGLGVAPGGRAVGAGACADPTGVVGLGVWPCDVYNMLAVGAG